MALVGIGLVTVAGLEARPGPSLATPSVSRRALGDDTSAAEAPSSAVLAAPSPGPAVGGAHPPRPAPVAGPPRTLVLMGDSVAASIGLALVAVAREHGVYVHNAAISGCGLIEGVASTPDGVLFPWSLACAELIARYERDVVAAHQPDVVVWMSAWESVDRSFEDGFRIRPGTVRGNLRLLAEIDEAAGRLRERGARLVLVLLAPPPAGSVDAARHDAIARLPYLNRLLEEYSRRHRDGVSVVYMSEFLCPSGPPCPDEVAGVTPRPDGVHFDAADGARWAAEQLVPRLVAPLVPGEPPVWAYVGVGRF